MEMNHNGNKLMKNPVGTGVWLPLGMKGQLIFSTRGAYDEEREESAFLRMAVMIAIGVPAACMTVRAAEIPAAPAEDDMAFRMAGVTVEAKRPDWESKLSPGTVTVIRPEEFKGEQKISRTF